MASMTIIRHFTYKRAMVIVGTIHNITGPWSYVTQTYSTMENGCTYLVDYNTFSSAEKAITRFDELVAEVQSKVGEEVDVGGGAL